MSSTTENEKVDNKGAQDDGESGEPKPAGIPDLVQSQDETQQSLQTQHGHSPSEEASESPSANDAEKDIRIEELKEEIKKLEMGPTLVKEENTRLKQPQTGKVYSPQVAYEILRAKCKKMGLEIVDTTHDGNCFFDAVLKQPYHSNPFHRPDTLRAGVVTFMKEKKDLLLNGMTVQDEENLFGKGNTYEQYCERMSKDGEWVDELVVRATAEVLQTNFCIVTSSPANDKPINIPEENDFEGNPMYLGNLSDFHYVSLVQEGSTSADRSNRSGGAHSVEGEKGERLLAERSGSYIFELLEMIQDANQSEPVTLTKPEDVSDMGQSQGLYVCYMKPRNENSVEKYPIYVGVGKNLRNRFQDHVSKKNRDGKEVSGLVKMILSLKTFPENLKDIDLDPKLYVIILELDYPLMNFLKLVLLYHFDFCLNRNNNGTRRMNIEIKDQSPVSWSARFDRLKELWDKVVKVCKASKSSEREDDSEGDI